MLPDSFARLGVPGGPWLEKRTVQRDAFPVTQDFAAELTAFERYSKARTVSILHTGGEHFISWCRLARIASGGFGTVTAAIDNIGDIWVVKKLRRTPYVWARESNKVSAGAGHPAPKPVVTDDHNLVREVEIATRFGGGKWRPMAFCTPTRAYLISRAARGDLADVMLMPPAQHGQGDAWPQRTLLFALSDLCADLTGMHDRGLVHNDLKANNVLLMPADSSGPGRFSLCDFGLSFSPQLGETSPTNSALGAPEVLAAEAGASNPFYDLSASDDHQPWRLRQRADIWSLGLMGMGVVAGQKLLEGALPARQFSSGLVDGVSLASSYREFEQVRGLGKTEVESLIQAEAAGDKSLKVACAKLWREVDRRAPHLCALLRDMVASTAALRPDSGQLAEQLAALTVTLPGGPPDRQSYFEQADKISKIDQAAAIARLWQHGAIRQGLLMHPAQFSAPRRAPAAPINPPDGSGRVHTNTLVEPIFQRAVATPGGRHASGAEASWAPLSPWFDPAYYAAFVQRGRLSLSACPEDRADALAAEAYATAGQDRGERASIYYDPVCYRLRRPALAEASFSTLVDDYRRYGIDHGIAASADFDPTAFGRRRAYDIQRWISSLYDGELAGELGRRPYLAAIAYHAAELRHRLQIPAVSAGEIGFPRMSPPGEWPT